MSLELRFERLIAAPPERVFDAFTSPAGPARVLRQGRSRLGRRVGAATCASAASGRSRSARRATRLYHHRHVFEAIERPRRILLATTETRLDGSSFVTSMEFTFAPRDGGTLMTHGPRRLPDRGAARRARHRASPRLRPLRAHALTERRPMSSSVLYMSMSLDGFITGPDDGPGQGLGAGGEVLHAWLGDRRRRPLHLRPGRSQRPGLRRADGDRSRAGRAPHVRHRRPLGRRSPRRRPDLRPDAGRAARAGMRTGSTTSPTASRARWRRRRRRRATPT